MPHGAYLTGLSPGARTGDDVGLLQGSGATLILCPLVLSRYGGSMESFSRLKAAGVRIGLGTDTFPPDRVETMRLGISLRCLTEHSVTACSSADFYNAATIHAADALGRSDLGRLAPGAKADTVLFDLSDFAIGQMIDPIQIMMLSGTGRDLRASIINGRVVMRDRILPGVDLEAWHRQAQLQFDGLAAKYPLGTLHPLPVEQSLAPSFREMVRGMALKGWKALDGQICGAANGVPGLRAPLGTSRNTNARWAVLPQPTDAFQRHFTIQPRLSEVGPFGLYSAPKGAFQPAAAIDAKIVP